MTVKGINLIPGEVRRRWLFKKVKTWVWAAFAVYIAVSGFVFYSQKAKITEKRRDSGMVLQEKEMLIAGSAQYAELAARFNEIQKTETGLKNRLELASALAEKRISWSTILRRLSHDIPAAVWLRSLATSDDQTLGLKKLRFSGSAASNSALADFIFTLENSGYFRDVALSYSQKRDFNSQTVYDFEISAALRKTGEIMYEW